jgi:hypothetical protein
MAHRRAPLTGAKRRRVDPEAAARRADDMFDGMHGKQEWDLKEVAAMSFAVGGPLDVDHEADLLSGEFRFGTPFENAACAAHIKDRVARRRAGGLNRTSRKSVAPLNRDDYDANPWKSTRADNCPRCLRAMESTQGHADLWSRFEMADEPRTESFFKRASVDVPGLRLEERSHRGDIASDRIASCALRFVYKREFTLYAFFDEGDASGEAVDTLYRPMRPCEHAD